MARHPIKRPKRIRIVRIPQVETTPYTFSAVSIDDIYGLILDSLHGKDISINSLFSGKFDFRIRICGEHWSGNIDYRIANFVLKIQQEILNLYNSYSEKSINSRSLYKKNKELVVRVCLKDGSSDIFCKITECIKSMAEAIKDMDSADKKKALISLMACCSITFCVYHGFNEYFKYNIERINIENKRILELKKLETDLEKSKLEHNAASEERAEKQKTLQEFSDIAKESIKSVIKILEPVKSLINQMDENDKIHLGNKIYSKREAEKLFSQPEDYESISTEETFQIDGKFDITDVSLENGNISVKKDGKKYKIITKLLPTHQKSELHNMYRACSLENTYPKKVPLQINLIVKDGEWFEAYICGLGKPRKGAISIEKALQQSTRQKQHVLQQGSLFEI